MQTSVHRNYPLTDDSAFVVGAVDYPTVAYFDNGPDAHRYQTWLAGTGVANTWSDTVRPGPTGGI